MVFKPPDFGPISRVFVGEGPPDTGVLTRINARRTGGSKWQIKMPTTWEPVTQSEVQSGLINVTFTLTFADVDSQSIRLALGNALTVSAVDDPLRKGIYTVLVLDAKPTSLRSFLFPEIQVTSDYQFDFDKLIESRVPVDFSATTDDIALVNTKLYRQGTWATLKTLLGSRSPI